MLNVANIGSGVEFENYIQDLLNEEGIQAFDTPTSNDYGADIIAKYKKTTIAIQCKFYKSQVGIKAVQEVMSSLNYYEADYGVVVTNSAFTQQAKNLARTNNILLISGDTSFSSFSKMFDKLFPDNYSKSMKHRDNSELMLDDLVVRYGVSRNSILKYFMANGLPYEKVGREYRFSIKAVEQWEIETRSINCGRSGDIDLPGYKQYIQRKYNEYLLARERNDLEAVKSLKADLKTHGYYVHGRAMLITLLICGIILALVAIYFLAEIFGVTKLLK